MTALEDRSAAEVATALGLSMGAIYMAKSRIVHRIRTIIHSVAAESWESPSRK